jgi:hypothetical protein
MFNSQVAGTGEAFINVWGTIAGAARPSGCQKITMSRDFLTLKISHYYTGGVNVYGELLELFRTFRSCPQQ